MDIKESIYDKIGFILKRNVSLIERMELNPLLDAYYLLGVKNAVDSVNMIIKERNVNKS